MCRQVSRLMSSLFFSARETVFTVNPCDLEIYMESEGKKIVEPGRYEVYAGGNCLDERVTAGIEL